MALGSGGNVINFSGLASGLDASSIIDALVQVRHQRIDQVQAQQATFTHHKTLYSNVLSALGALNTIAMGMDSRLDFGPLQATTGDAAVMTAASGAGAVAGTYSVVVKQVASTQRTYSNAVTSPQQTGQLGTGTLTWNYPDKPSYSVTLDASTTLQSLADSINDVGSGVSATVVREGALYRLALSGVETGAAHAFAVHEEGSTTGLGDAKNTAQAAQDAQITLDGLATITRPSNTINDAVRGVTLQIQRASSVPQQLTIAVDGLGVQNQIQEFVNGYNSIVTAIQDATRFNQQYDPQQLTGDPSLRDLTQQLQRLVSSPIANTPGNYHALSQIGITTGSGGTLTVNAKKLQTALAADYQGVARLFIYDPTVETRGVAAQLEHLQRRYTDFFKGSIATAVTRISGQVLNMTDQMRSMQRNVDAYKRSLQYKFNTLETTMSRLQSQGAYLGKLQAAQSTAAANKR